MKVSAASVLRPAALATHPSPFRQLLAQRCYATQNSLGSGPGAGATPRRRAVTPFNDDGHVPWTELSAGEKTARAAQQTFNFGLVLVGVVLTVSHLRHCRKIYLLTLAQGGVGYFLYQEVFSSDSKVAYFNRAVDRIKKDPKCLELLGDGKKITAYGEETWNKWRRARPIAYVSLGCMALVRRLTPARSTVKRDQYGNDHLIMHFNVCFPSKPSRWLRTC